MFVIIAGPAMGNGHITSDVNREPNDYIANIVYGDPKITTVVTGRSFVALCEFETDYATAVNAQYTYERMGSFGYGSKIAADPEVAYREFGISVAMAAPTMR